MPSLQKALVPTPTARARTNSVAELGAAVESEKKKNRVEPNQEPGAEASESDPLDVASRRRDGTERQRAGDRTQLKAQRNLQSTPSMRRVILRNLP